MATDSEVMPKALTDFVFDLSDSVTTSQIAEEQKKLYEVDFNDLSQKYFANTAWPSPQTIAAECNGDPLFLAVYRELTHRHWHAVSRPNLRDRMEGWQVYRELFEELLDSDASDYYLLPGWVFDILNEFVYQFQGFCQIRSAVYVSARKNGLLNEDGTRNTNAPNANQNLIDNLNTLEGATEAWEVQAVFSYLHRLTSAGWPLEGKSVLPVHTYLSLFGSVSTSRLECLLGDFSACLQALEPLDTHANYTIPKTMEDDSNKQQTVAETLASVFGARVSIAYHAGVSLLVLRRYKDALSTLAPLCATLQRGFQTGQVTEQYSKQYDRMLALVALLTHLVPGSTSQLEDSVVRAIREKHGSKLQAATSYEEWFQAPKFIAATLPPTSNTPGTMVYYRQQVLKEFLQETKAHGRDLHSYLSLYATLPLHKLAHLHDSDTVDDFLPLLLQYKLRMRQLERPQDTSSDAAASFQTALDIQYYVVDDMVHVDEAEKPRRLEHYFVDQMEQDYEIRQKAIRIDTKV